MCCLGAVCGLRAQSPATHERQSRSTLLVGSQAFGDFHQDYPGLRRLIRPADLPHPDASAATENFAAIISRPKDAWPVAPAGFTVDLVATGLENPRKIICSPNGDFFVADSAANNIKVIHGFNAPGAAQVETFASGLSQPFGIAFYPPGPNPRFLYVANTDSVVRFPYQSGDLRARGTAQKVVSGIPGGGHLAGGGHWTRDIAFDKEGKTMFVSVGSRTNDEKKWFSWLLEGNRADILAYDPGGSKPKVYAWGIRNPVGIAIDPATGQLWASVNERDGLGDDVPPDYITHISPGAFYGWPWYYAGGNPDPFHEGEHSELRDKSIVPDVLIQAHSASLCLTFYTGSQFPARYSGQIFAAEHGSWNRSKRTGYKVVFVPLQNGHATGEYEDFLTGFVTQEGKVWGRPVGVAVGADGSLFVTDDASGSVWRVRYGGNGR